MVRRPFAGGATLCTRRADRGVGEYADACSSPAPDTSGGCDVTGNGPFAAYFMPVIEEVLHLSSGQTNSGTLHGKLRLAPTAR